MGITISLLNEKRGGKTSTCHHLAGTLANAGQRVLLLDNDPQASLSQGFCGPDATRRIGAAESVAALHDADLAPIPEALSESLQAAPAGERGVRQRASVGSTNGT
jgi:cellulose biosynthesis protein BcsQ